MKDISPRQEAILNFIKKQTRTKGYPPSVREIGQAVGLHSSSTVHGHLRQLEKYGYIRRDPTKPRAIEILHNNFAPVKEMVNLPIVGKVTAGTPILATENVEDVFSLPLDFVGEEESFMLRIQGESMIGAGILDGDYVVIRRQNSAQNGDIVVALLEDEATVKRFYREADHVRLQPENPQLDPILTREVTILGKVVGLVRRIH
ncbi:MAG: transcriptional repressor LexA [Syntrophomonadaceae bacterium]|nr:transcriptional repressor LexA [Syntrophomonadaceae bacterium]